MKIRTFFYCLKQGFINLKRNRLFTLASVGTITACIFLIGLFYAFYSVASRPAWARQEASSRLEVSISQYNSYGFGVDLTHDMILLLL